MTVAIDLRAKPVRWLRRPGGPVPSSLRRQHRMPRPTAGRGASSSEFAELAEGEGASAGRSSFRRGRPAGGYPPALSAWDQARVEGREQQPAVLPSAPRRVRPRAPGRPRSLPRCSARPPRTARIDLRRALDRQRTAADRAPAAIPCAESGRMGLRPPTSDSFGHD